MRRYFQCSAASRQGQGDETKEARPMPDQHGPEDHGPADRDERCRPCARRCSRARSRCSSSRACSLYVLNGLAVDSMAAIPRAGRPRRCAVRGPLRAEREPRHAVARGSRRRALITLEARLWRLDPRVNRVLEDAIAMAFLLWVLVVVLREVFRPARRSWMRSSARCAASCSSSRSSCVCTACSRRCSRARIRRTVRRCPSARTRC